jgi:hypothetical protein
VLPHIAHPAELLGILLAALGLVLHDVAQVFALRAVGLPGPLRQGRLRPEAGRFFDVYGLVGLLLTGLGWLKPVEVNAWRPSERKRAAVGLAAGPVVLLVLAVVWAFLAHAQLDSSGFAGPSFGFTLCLYAGFYSTALFVLSCLPVPPVLDGGRILFLLAPRSRGWMQAEYNLVERNWGLIIAMVLVLAPLLLPPLNVAGHIAVPLFNALFNGLGTSAPTLSIT